MKKSKTSALFFSPLLILFSSFFFTVYTLAKAQIIITLHLIDRYLEIMMIHILLAELPASQQITSIY